MKNTANKSPDKRWEKTKVHNLVRHKSGRYYARLFGNNKEIWKSLDIEHLQVAKARSRLTATCAANSIAQAQRVSFAPATQEAGAMIFRQHIQRVYKLARQPLA